MLSSISYVPDENYNITTKKSTMSLLKNLLGFIHFIFGSYVLDENNQTFTESLLKNVLLH